MDIFGMTNYKMNLSTNFFTSFDNLETSLMEEMLSSISSDIQEHNQAFILLSGEVLQSICIISFLMLM